MEQAELTREIDALRQEAAELQCLASTNPQQAAEFFSQCCKRLQQAITSLDRQALQVSVATAQAQATGEARLQALLENCSDAVEVLDGTGRRVWISPSSPRILGYPVEEGLGTYFLKWVHPADLPQCIVVAAKLLARPGTCITSAARARHKDGSWRWLEARLVNLLHHPAVRGIVVTTTDVTPRKQAEKVLQQTRDDLQATLAALPDLLFEVDRESRILNFHAPHPELLYRPPEEFLGKRMTAMLPPAAGQVIQAALAEAAQAGRHSGATYSLETPAGRNWFELSIAAKGDHRPPDAHFVILVRDITARQQTVAALRESEDRLRAFLDGIPQPAWHCAGDGMVLDCNQRWYDYTGQTPEEARGYGWMKALHPDDTNHVAKKVEDVVTQRVYYETEYRLRRASDGAYRWHIARAFPVKDDQGKVISWFGSGADVHDQKEAAELLRQDRDQLERRVADRTAELAKLVEQLSFAEERFRQLAQSIDEVFWMFDLNLTECLYISPAYETVWGQSCDSLRKDPRSFLAVVHPEDQALAAELLEQHFRAGQPFTAEVRLLSPGRSLRWVLTRGFPILDATGKPYRMAGVSQDITERRRLEQAILDVAEREQQRIAQDLHDGLANQLTGLSFLTKGLEKKLAAQARPESADVHHISQLLQESIGQVRGISRGLHPVDAAPGGLVAALTNLAASQAELYHITCHCQCAPTATVANPVTATHLYRIAQEAVHNAIKHGHAKHITIKLAIAHGLLTLAVRDDGIGFPDQLPAQRGLGVGIMHHRADAIGAVLEIHRTGKSGTQVTCRLGLPAAGNRG